MITFICAVFNEENEIIDIINHVYDYVDELIFCNDGSTDDTAMILDNIAFQSTKVKVISIPHTGLPETVKNRALKEATDSGWVLMLDADERFAPGVLDKVISWINSSESSEYDYAYFNQLEIIDGIHVRTFQKSKLFRKKSISFSSTIHEDDKFEGKGFYKEEWIVFHRKTRSKQINREKEYLETYKKLLAEGKIDEGRYNWLVGLHHYIKG